MNKTAVVTGAGSGVGRAIALKLAEAGWRVALVGRRAAALDNTVTLAGKFAGQFLVCPCDIGDVNAVGTMAKVVMAEFDEVEVLVNTAGTNTPQRSFSELSLADYHMLMDANLNGAYFCVQAFLPWMRSRRSGTIINIVSEAGKQANSKAGPAYTMSKFGLAGLTQAINAEERSNGVRACAIFPGDIDTGLLDKRPAPPTQDSRAQMMRADDVAECALFAINLPSRVIVEEMLVRPR